MSERTVNQLVDDITTFVNSFTPDEEAFIKSMSTQHRTLQQSFTRLVIKWLEFVSSKEYKYDDRNLASHQIANRLVEDYKARYMTNPSKYLPFI